MNSAPPPTLIADSDYDNQFSALMRPRDTQFIIPDSDITVSETGATINFTVSDHKGFYNFRDSCLVFKANFTAADGGTGNTYDYDWSKVIDTIIVKNAGETLVNIHDAWAVEQVMQKFRGTEESSANGGQVSLKGNARLYRAVKNAEFGTKHIYIAIPLSRFTDFFLNEKYQNRGNTQISIRISSLIHAFSASSDDVSITTPTLTECRFTMCRQNLDATVQEAFDSQISEQTPMIQNMTSYIVRNFGINSNAAVINDAPQVSSLDRIHGFITNGTTRECIPITNLSSLNVRINGKALKDDGINSTGELGIMTLESANMTSNQFSGMTPGWLNNWCNTADANPVIEVFSLQTAFEADSKIKGGLMTINQQKLTGDYKGTAEYGTLLWIIIEYTGSLITYPNKVMWAQ